MVIPTRFSQKLGRSSSYNSIIIISSLLLSSILIITAYHVFKVGNRQQNPIYQPVILTDANAFPTKILEAGLPEAESTNSSCTFFGCFNLYRCGSRGNKLLVYVYPPKIFLDHEERPVASQITKEFYQILYAIVSSKFYTPNPREACIFVPSIDTLNQNRLRLQQVSQALQSLEL